MKVLFISGPHAGWVKDLDPGMRSYEIPLPDYSRGYAFRHGESKFEPTSMMTEWYHIRTAHLRHDLHPRHSVYQAVAQHSSDNREPTLALLEYTLQRCLHNPTNP